jgi:hypothetical protein
LAKKSPLKRKEKKMKEFLFQESLKLDILVLFFLLILALIIIFQKGWHQKTKKEKGGKYERMARIKTSQRRLVKREKGSGKEKN